jgi:hypothetical protein
MDRGRHFRPYLHSLNSQRFRTRGCQSYKYPELYHTHETTNCYHTDSTWPLCEPNSPRTTRNEVGGNLSGNTGEPDSTPSIVAIHVSTDTQAHRSPRGPQAARTRGPDVVGRVSSLPPSVAMEHVNELAYISGMRLMAGWCHCPTYPDMLCRDGDTFCTNAC